MDEQGEKKGGLLRTLLTVLACLIVALLVPVSAIAAILCVLGEKEASYNAQVAKALFAESPWPPPLSIETDRYYGKMRCELEDLMSAWLRLHRGDPGWDEDDHEEESLLMRVCFYVMFYKCETEFEDEDYEFFAKLFDDAPTVNQAFWLLDFFYGEFNDKQQKAVRDCVFLVTTDKVPPEESDVSPAFGTWNQEMNLDWHELPGNEDGPEVARLAKTRVGDPYAENKVGRGKNVDCSWLAKWCWAQVGVTLPRKAAEQAKYLTEQGRSISPGDLRKGDLVYWSYGPNGSYQNVTHVGIYVGDGKVVHASWSLGKVVKSGLFDYDKIVLCARPAEPD